MALIPFFQNCGKFQSLATPAELSSTLSSSTPTPSPTVAPAPSPGPTTSPTPAPTPTPPPATPTPTPDYSSNVLLKMGVSFGPKNGSTCELAPPTIPAFHLPSDDATVFKVCTDGSCPFTTIQSALDAAPAGSTVAVKAADYNECLRIRRNNILLQGRGGRPHISATGCPAAPYSGAIIALDATGIRIENFEISDPMVTTQIAVSTVKTGLDFTLVNLHIHHVTQGLYTVTSGNMIMHNLYLDHVGHLPNIADPTHVTKGLAPKGSYALIKNSVEVRPTEKAEGFSPAAETNILDCVVVADLDSGISSYQMAFGLGQNTTVTNSVLQKGPLGDQKPFLYWNRTELRAVAPADQLTFKNNIVITDRPFRDRPILDLRLLVPSTIEDNTFIGPDSDTFGKFPKTTIYLSRTLAGIPTALTQLPYPGSKVGP